MDKIKSFLVSNHFTAVLFALACVIVFTSSEIVGTILFVFIFALQMAVCNDWIPMLQTLMFTVCFAIRCKNSFDDFIRFWWIAPIIAALVVFHFIKYKPKLAKGSCFYGVLAASIAVTLGGVGIISPKEYFNYTSIFYVFVLGFGMLLAYSYMSATLKNDSLRPFSDRFSKMMICIILLLGVCLFEEYFSHRDLLAEKFDIIPFQWRNNAATLLMLAMPFPFYKSVNKFGYFLLGIIDYVFILFTGSRGGMLFGLIELIICIIAMFVIDKKHRLYISFVIITSIVLTALTYNIWTDTLSYTLMRLIDPNENSIRLQLIPRGIEDFKANPLFGRGIGYMGNRDIHKSAAHALCWYHCSPIQVIGSFGICGVLAYGYLIFLRIKTLFKNFTFFNIILFISYLGLELMSLVNPGIFAPFPYLFLATLYFVIMERCNSDEDKKALSKIFKGENK